MKNYKNFQLFENQKNWLGQKYSIQIPDRYINEHTDLWKKNKIKFELNKDDALDNEDWTMCYFQNFDDFNKAYNLSKKLEMEKSKSETPFQDWKKTKYVPGFLTGWSSVIKKGHGLFGTKNIKKISPFFGLPN